MDVFEIMGTVRGYSKLRRPEDIADLVLLRHINMAQMAVCQVLLPVFKQYLVKSVIQISISGTQVTIPGDSLRLVNVEREQTAAANNYRPAAPVKVEDKVYINVSPDLVASAANPLYVDEGRYLNLYPTMSSLDVRLTYRKRIADLVYNRVASVVGAPNGSSQFTMTVGASLDDDVYNDYQVAIYKVTSAVHTLLGIHTITDYVGSTRTVTISPASSIITGDEAYYSLVPIIPGEFHNLLVDAAMIELRKSGFEIPQIVTEESLYARMNTILVGNGYAKFDRGAN